MCCVANEHTDEPLSLHSLHSTYIQIYLLHREVRGQGNTEQVLSIHCLAYAPHEYTWSPWIGLTVFILWRASPIVSPHVIVEADLTLNTNILYHQRENDNKKIESSNKSNGYWKDAQNCWPQIHLVCAHAVTVICSLIAVLIPLLAWFRSDLTHIDWMRDSLFYTVASWTLLNLSLQVDVQMQLMLFRY